MKYKIKFATFTLAIAVMLLNTNIHCMSNDIKNSTERVINQSSSSNTILETNTNATVGFVSYMTKEGIFVTKYYDDSLKREEEKLTQMFEGFMAYEDAITIIQNYTKYQFSQ